MLFPSPPSPSGCVSRDAKGRSKLQGKEMIALNTLRDMGRGQEQKAQIWRATVGLSYQNPQARITQISNTEDRDRG